MSRPFDDTRFWWREELGQIAQIVHQAHTDKAGTWHFCPMASCTRVRDVIEASHAEIDTIDIHPEDVVFVRVKRRS